MRPENPASFQKDYCTALAVELARRFPDNGTKVEVYVFAHLLHPFYRGAILKNFDSIWSNNIKEFIRQNEEAPEVVADINVNVAVDSDENEDDFFDAALKFTQNMEEQSAEGLREGPLTPLTIELDSYLALPRLNTPKVDILAWWKSQQHAFPLLAQCARKYHCIPASSAPSERLFSSSGNLVSAKRSSLNTKNVDMMVFLHENMEKLQLTSFDYNLIPQEDQEEEEEVQVMT